MMPLSLPFLVLLFIGYSQVYGCGQSVLAKYNINLLAVGETPEWYHEAQQSAGVLGQDGGNAIPLDSEYTWMIFGDTIPSQGSWRSNSGLLVQSENGIVKNASYVVGDDGLVAQLVPFVGNESTSITALWCGAGIYALNTTWIFYGANPRSGNGQGTAGLASAPGFSSNFTRQEFSPLLAGFYPNQLVVEQDTDISDPATYLYMYLLTPGFLEFQIHIARVTLGDLLDAASFHTKIEWYTEHLIGKPTWKILSPNSTIAMQSAATLLKGAGAQITAFWSEYLQSYTLLLAPEFSNKIEMATSPTPWGPWSCNTLLVTVPLQNTTKESVYCPYLQPQLSNSSQTVSLTYSISGEDSFFVSPFYAQVELSPK